MSNYITISLPEKEDDTYEIHLHADNGDVLLSRATVTINGALTAARFFLLASDGILEEPLPILTLSRNHETIHIF